VSKTKKYQKYFTISEASTAYNKPLPPGVKKTSLLVYSYNNHDEAPHYFEANMTFPGQDSISGNGSKLFYPRNSWLGLMQEKTNVDFLVLPHKHPFKQVFHVMSIDPDNVDKLDETQEYWLGEGEDAEKYIVNKPSVIIVPGGLVHLPWVKRDIKKSSLRIMYSVSSMYARVTKWKKPVYPPSFEYTNIKGWIPKPMTAEQANKKDYAHLLQAVNLRDWMPTPPAHKGKACTIMHTTWATNPEIPWRFDCTLIYGSEIGFGIGDWKQFPPLPNKNNVYETISFLNLDPDCYDDLGGTVEFWMGEGEDAEEYIIDRPTIIIIPPNVVHYPIYVRECHKPFVMASILESPLWAGKFVEKFPPNFKHTA
jgi:hypothetical protein